MKTARRGLLAIWLAVLVVLVAPAAMAQDADDQTSPLFVRQVDATDPEKIGVSLVYNGERSDLEKLTVRENGRQVETEPVVPLSDSVRTGTVLVVDTSGSMRDNGALEEAREGLTAIIEQKRDDDAVAVVGFSSDAQVYTKLTTDPEQALAALDDLAADDQPGTALWDGVVEGADLFDAEEDLQANVVLVTDGLDDASSASPAQARGALARADATVFAMGIDEDQLDEASLEELVDAAGGLNFLASSTEEVGEAFDEVASSLRNQFVVEFPSRLSDAERQADEAIDLEVSVGNHSDEYVFRLGSVTEGSAGQPEPASEPFGPDFLRTTAGKMVALAIAGVAVALVVYSVVMLVTKDTTKLDSMLRPYADDVGEEETEEGALAQTAFLQRAVEFTGDLAERQGFLTKVEASLERANLPLRAAEALFFWVVTAAIVAVLGLLFGGLFGGLIALVFGALVPPAALRFLAARRRKQFLGQLPDMLQLLAGSLRAGYSLMQGVEAVSQEVTEPMGKELRRVVTEARLGRQLEESLDGISERMASPDFAWAVMAIRIQREVGGNLAELLMTVGETMIARERLRREVAALTAEGKISAIVLGLLPVGLGAVMYVVNPDYMSLLFSETQGKVMLGSAIVAALIGFAWMKKTITITI